MSDNLKYYLRGFRDASIIILLFLAVYLCKMAFQYNEAHYVAIQNQINELEAK